MIMVYLIMVLLSPFIWLAKVFERLFKIFNKKTKPFVKTIERKVIEPIIEATPRYRPVPKHNNRKRTPGRRIQIIQLANNHTKLIYHTL